MSIVLGIDPGWASCGVALTIGMDLRMSCHFIPRDKVTEEVLVGSVEYLTDTILGTERCGGYDFDLTDISDVYIERYVAYKGVQSQAAEDILLFIGALIHRFEFDGISVHPVRAIDWKPKVCKYLVRTKGFNNPYPSFDKKFSILAAKELSGIDFKTDHEADAVCLSYLGEIEKYNKEKKK